jgi:hypothetical protein
MNDIGIKFEDLVVTVPDLTVQHDNDEPYSCRAVLPVEAAQALKIQSIKLQLMRDHSFPKREVYTIGPLNSTRTNRRVQSARGQSKTFAEMRRHAFEVEMGTHLRDWFWGKLIEAGWKMNDQRGVGGDVHWLPPWKTTP